MRIQAIVPRTDAPAIDVDKQNVASYAEIVNGSQFADISTQKLAGAVPPIVPPITQHEIEKAVSASPVEGTDLLQVNGHGREPRAAGEHRQRRACSPCASSRPQNGDRERIAPVDHGRRCRPPRSARSVGLAIAIALVVGLIANGVLLVLLDLFRDRFASPEELEAATGRPVLAVVPRLARAPSGPRVGPLRPSASVSPRPRRRRARRGRPDEHPHRLPPRRTRRCRACGPPGPRATPFCTRSRRRPSPSACCAPASASRAWSGRCARLLIAAPRARSGKSTIAANLALSFSQVGERVLLVDADLRRPSLSRIFNIQARVGLTTLLLRGGDLSDHIVADIHEGLDLMPSGPLPPNPSELLSSQRLVDALARMAENYDVVLLDAPPALVTTDSVILASLVDGTLCVVDLKGTRRRDVQRTMGLLDRAGARVIGTCVNRYGRASRGESYY